MADGLTPAQLDALAAKHAAPSAPPPVAAAPTPAPPKQGGLTPQELDRMAAPNPPPASGAGRIAKKALAAATSPLAGIDAVLGAPERAVEGAVGSQGSPLQRAGHGVYEAFHPGDQKTRDANLERAQQRMGMGGRDTAAGFGHGVHNFVRDAATQTILDPLTYIPFVGEGRMVERAIVGGAKALNHIMPPAARGVVQKTSDFFRANPEMDRALGNKGAAIYHGIYRSERGKLGVQAMKDAQMLQRNHKAIAAGEIPMDVRSRLLQEPYDHGSPEMRAEAVKIAHDQGIPLNEHADPPTNSLSYPVRSDYDDLMRKTTMKEGEVHPTPQKPFTRIEQKPANAGFEKQRTQEGTEQAETLEDRIGRRLANGRNVIFERSVDDRLLRELVGPNKIGPQAGALLQNPEAYHSLRASGVTQGARVAGVPALQKLSDAYRMALFVNPLPHMFNIARLAYLAGGTEGVARGISHFVRGGPQGALRHRLEEHTGLPEFLSGDAPHYADFVPGVRALRQYGQRKLSTFDASMRAAYLQELDKARGVGPEHSLGEYEKGREVSNSLGGYDETSPLVEAIRAAGGPFAAWRLHIVPQAVGKAIARNPGRVERYSRNMQSFNQNTGANVEFGGPVEDFGRLASVPTGTARYLMSPSTLGPVPAGIAAAASSTNRGADLATLAKEGVRNYIPGGGILESATGTSPYPEGPNTAANTGLSLIGGYTQQSAAQKKRSAAISKRGHAAVAQSLKKGNYQGAWTHYWQMQRQLRDAQMRP